MSSTSSATSGIPSGLVITGGIPSHADLAPSGIFLAIFILLVIPAIWRVARSATRTVVLIRPCILIAVRIAAYITRILIAKTPDSSEGLYIAEIVLISIGIIFLTEPLSALIQRSVLVHAPHDRFLHTLMRGLRLILIAALVMSIYSASNYTDASQVSTVRALRTASNALILVCILLSFGTTLMLSFVYAKDTFPRRATMFLVYLSVVLFVAAIYKLIQGTSHSASAPINNRAAFYILLSLPEVLAVVSFFAVDLVDIFDLHTPLPDEKSEKPDQSNGNYA